MTSRFRPIAIIGIGCRFPGGCDDPETFWKLLQTGNQAIIQTPADRWSLERFYMPGPPRPGKTQSRWGGYVDDIDQFDPQLFGISPREAVAMDPQQRMLLETAYRAAEDAGVPLATLAGQSVSVHVGISSIDYAVGALSFHDRGVIGPYSNTGGSSSIAANRISYCFDLRGESVAVDTACSSSLIAMHLACKSLQDDTNRMAFAGGVNALILPDFHVAFSQLGVLSPDGKCKTFDAAANGYVRSEGAGMVLLKRLEDAIADGDSIYAVIHGSATNQDGRTDGLTVPSRTAQQRLIASALATAGISGHDISYVEAHGTGTPIGDPIEAGAISACYGRSGGEYCHVGSVKTNIGHLEAGAGIASVIKVALAIKHATIPAHLNFETLNSKIDFESNGLRIPLSTQPWNVSGSRLAGINGFGYGGANAHLILGQPPQSSNMPSAGTDQIANRLSADRSIESYDDRPLLVPISAHDKGSLALTAARWADWLETSDVPLKQIAASAAFHRSHHDWRAVVVGNRRKQWIEQLRAIAGDVETHARMIQFRQQGESIETTPEIAFVCSGQGPQWWAMGRGFLQSNDVFRSMVLRCDREFAKHVRWSLYEELSREETESRIQETAIAQPCLFALQVALAAVWRSVGVRPGVIVGHSVGEIAAAYLSGALGFSDACRVAIHRGRTMDAASSKGAMIAVGLSRIEIEPWINPLSDRVSIAAINGPASITVSGCAIAISELQQRLDRSGVFCRRLDVEYAFHSAQMDPVREELLHSLESLAPQSTDTDWISTVTGDLIDGRQADALYWWSNVREKVRFADAMDRLAERKIQWVIEVGPHPVLRYSIAECFSQHNRPAFTFASLHHKHDDEQQFAESIGQLYTYGYPIDWKLVSPASDRHVKLPPLVMNKQSLWMESFDCKQSRFSSPGEAVLGRRVDGPEPRWQTRVDLRLQQNLTDHRVRNACVMPAAAMLEFAITAASVNNQTDSVSLRRFQLQGPCLLDEASPIRLQIEHQNDRGRIRLSTSNIDASNWQPLAIVDHSGVPSAVPNPSFNPNQVRVRLSESVSADRLYRHCQALGLNYGPSFRGVQQGWRRSFEAIVEVDLHRDDTGVTDGTVLRAEAALLDSCFHGMIIASPDFDHTVGALYLPQRIASIDVYRSLTTPLTAHVRLISKDAYRMIADIDVYDIDLKPCVCIRGFESVAVTGTQETHSIDELLYRYVWKPAAQIPTPVSDGQQRKWLVFSDQSGMATEIAKRFPATDVVITVQHGSNFKRLRDHSLIIDPESRDQFDRMLTDIGDGITDIVYLWGLDAADNVELSESVLQKSTILTTLAPMHLAAAWQAAADTNRQSKIARLLIITRNAQPPDETLLPISIAAGPLIGFGRVIASECGRLKTRLIDLACDEQHAPENVMTEIVQRLDDEDEVLIRDSIRWVRRFVPALDHPIHPESDRRLPCALRPGTAASIDELHYETVPRSVLGDDQVEIEVVAAGLNFSDVMKSLNLYPGLPDGPVVMGAECSGRICRIGKQVTDFRVGDEVIAVAPGSFASHVIVDHWLVAAKPKSLTHVEAAGLPIAFLTAQYALNECARLRRGERILIHAASGGVGIAAIQLAIDAGASVYATAGTNAKRDYVRLLGAEHVMDSRSLDFARQTIEHTGGIGVDAVLNSLPGEAINKGLSVLQTGGRFLEIGKRDIYADASIGLEVFKNNLALFAIDLDQLFREQPQRMGKMLRDLVVRFDRGELFPLPVNEFDADETQDAFRLMQQGKHIGKVVIHYRATPSQVFMGRDENIHFSPERSYWIAGGLGGFGLRVAQWLIDRGARHVILGGRSTEVDAETRSIIDRWQNSGTSIHLVSVDLTCGDSVRAAVATIDRDCPPLAGVFHTAMILEDKLVADLDRDTLQRVLAPKVLGGWNLHQATGDHDLDHFIMFSSLSSVFGHAGQANYAAANAFLDSLAHYRRSLGMPGLAINWGHVGEVGYLSKRSELSQRLERQGVLTFSADEAMKCMERSIQGDAIQQSVLRMDWTRWRGLGITGDVSVRFAHLLRGTSQETSEMGRLATAAEIRSASPADRQSLVATLVGTKAASLLGITLPQMQWDRPLLSMGLDSLMAVEMRNWIESRLEIDLPISDLMRSESLLQVCHDIAQIVTRDPNQSHPVAAETLLSQLPDMSDANVDALLTEMLNSTNPGLSRE